MLLLGQREGSVLDGRIISRFGYVLVYFFFLRYGPITISVFLNESFFLFTKNCYLLYESMCVVL